MRKKLLKLLALSALALCPFNHGCAQRVVLKTNALQWALNSPNLEVEARLGRRLALDVALLGSPVKWSIAGNRVNSIRFEPHLRYYFNRPMARNFLSLDLGTGMYDAIIRKNGLDSRHKGIYAQAGVSYGYVLVLRRNWNIEFSLGVAAARIREFDYPNGTKRPSSPNSSRWLAVPSNLGVTFSYIFE